MQSFRTAYKFRKLHQMPSAELERDQREEVLFATRVRVAGCEERIDVVNISRRGVGAKIGRSLMIGTPLEIELPFIGFVTAHVRWALGGSFGAAFTDKIKDRYPFVLAACRAATTARYEQAEADFRADPRL